MRPDQTFRDLIFEDCVARYLPRLLYRLTTPTTQHRTCTFEKKWKASTRMRPLLLSRWCVATMCIKRSGLLLWVRSCHVSEKQNHWDPFAVAVTRSGVTVGHIPRKISSTCSMFLRRVGMVTCRVTGERRYSEDLIQGGLEIPCILLRRGAAKNIEKVKKLLELRQQSPPHTNKENEPPKKRFKVDISNSYLDMVTSYEKLSDIQINLAQQLLKKQLPSVNGLQSTLLQSKPRAGEPPNNQLQIIRSRGDHWIVASTVGCTNSVCVYDSVYNILDEGTIDVIFNLFHSSKVKMMEYKKQAGGKDCGLFAIAYATAISHGVDPSGMELNQAIMWNHLSKCLKKKILTLFPCV